MQVGPKLSGFKYLYATSSPDTVVVRVRDVLLRKHEWIVTRDTMPAVCGKMVVGLPQYLVENGTYSRIEQELQRWMHPGLHEFFGGSR